MPKRMRFLRARALAEAQHALGALARQEVDRAGTESGGTDTKREASAEVARAKAESLVNRAAELQRAARRHRCAGAAHTAAQRPAGGDWFWHLSC